MGVITDTLRANLRQMAESDARFYRELAAELPATLGKRRRALPSGASQIDAAIALLEANGYTVTPPQG